MRPPEVFVRELTPEDANRLKSISRRAKHQCRRERAMIVLASQTGMGAPQIAALVRTDDSHVRKVIHAFNERGFDSLDPDYRGGRRPKTTPGERDQVVAIARARPRHPRRAFDPLVAAAAERAPGRARCSDRALPRGAAPALARGWPLPPAHALVEVEPRSVVQRARRAGPGSLPRAAGRRGRRLLRRDGPDPADPQSGIGLGSGEDARAPPRHLQPKGRRPTATTCTGGFARARASAR